MLIGMEPLTPRDTAGTKSGRFRVRLLGFFLGTSLALLVGGGFAAWRTMDQLAGAWTAHTLPAELRSGVFLSVNPARTVAYSVNGSTLTRNQYPGTRAALFARQDGSVLDIRFTAPATYTLHENGVERVRTKVPLEAPSLAPHTKVLAFAQSKESLTHTDKNVPHPLSAANPGQWDIRLGFPQGSTSAPLATGYAPLFIDDSHLVFFGPAGIYGYDLSAGTITRLATGQFPLLLGPVVQSPDRTLFALRDAVKKTTSVYRVDLGKVVLIREIPEILVAPALSDSALYNLVGTGHGGEVWRYGLAGGDAKRIYTLPKMLSISRIVF
jgi:hypothetical protein